MIWCWESFQWTRRIDLLLFCGFLEETTTLIGFDVEKHSLAYWRYHPGISPCYSGVSSLQWLCSSANEGARVREGFCVVARDQRLSCIFLLTQLRTRQGASFEPPVITLWRWNLSVHSRQPESAQLLRRDIWGFRGSFRSNSRKPSRLSIALARVHISRYIATDFVNGITRAHSLSPGGAQPPKGWHSKLPGSDLQSVNHQ